MRWALVFATEHDDHLTNLALEVLGANLIT
jgi:hypothetical protein